MTREQEIEKAARDLIRAYGYSVTPGDPMRLNEYEALQALRKVCGFPRGVLPATPPPRATAAPDEEEKCPRCEKRQREGVRGPVCDHRAPAEEEKGEARPELVEVTDQGGEPVAYFTRERINAVAFEALLRDGPFLLDIPPDLTEQIAYEWWRETPCDCGDHGCHYQMAVPEDPDAFAATVWHVEGRGWLGRAPSRGEVG